MDSPEISNTKLESAIKNHHEVLRAMMQKQSQNAKRFQQGTMVQFRKKNCASWENGTIAANHQPKTDGKEIVYVVVHESGNKMSLHRESDIRLNVIATAVMRSSPE